MADMLDCELRFLGTNLRASTVFLGCYFNDDAAIKAALRTARGQPVKVWRGARRIFHSPLTSRPTMLSRDQDMIEVRPGVIERAFQLTKSGDMANLNELRKQLYADGYFDADRYVASRSISRQLTLLIARAVQRKK